MRLFVVCLLMICIAACAPHDGITREWNGEVLVSETDPAATFVAAPEFEYVGAFAFDLRDTARVERHLWAERNGNEVEGLVIIQFERLLDHVEGTYGFAVPPADEQSGGDYLFSPERVSFGGPGLVQNTWAFNQADNAAANPDAESAATLAFLRDNGLTLADEVIMSRAVRVASDDERAEIILFYMEPLARRGETLAEFDPDGPLTAKYEQLSNAVTARHLEVMREVTSR